MEKDQEKKGLIIVKINSLSVEEFSKIQLGELWVIKPEDGNSTRSTLCGCRNICIAAE